MVWTIRLLVASSESHPDKAMDKPDHWGIAISRDEILCYVLETGSTTFSGNNEQSGFFLTLKNEARVNRSQKPNVCTKISENTKWDHKKETFMFSHEVKSQRIELKDIEIKQFIEILNNDFENKKDKNNSCGLYAWLAWYTFVNGKFRPPEENSFYNKASVFQ